MKEEEGRTIRNGTDAVADGSSRFCVLDGWIPFCFLFVLSSTWIEKGFELLRIYICVCEFDKKINIRLRNVLYIFIIYFYFILYVKIT